jgi:hypothetical protein
MDTFREMQMLNEMWEKGRAPWMTWDDGAHKNMFRHKVPA